LLGRQWLGGPDLSRPADLDFEIGLAREVGSFPVAGSTTWTSVSTRSQQGSTLISTDTRPDRAEHSADPLGVG
jgi:hypothetical protein